jgi:acetate kinase
MLLFDPDPPHLRWRLSEGGGSFPAPVEGHCLAGAGWAEQVARSAPEPAALKCVGYLLHNGGEIIADPVSQLTPEGLEKVRQTVRLLPEHNDLTCRVAQEWMTRRPDVPHVLLCDTAFFCGLPPEASLYAIPYELRTHGIKRYGGYGLCHEWVWRQVVRLQSGRGARVVSVYLGDHTNVAAIRDGLPLDTTIGFSQVEGIISATACGDIDPTVVFQMQSAGMSLEQIRSLLSDKSGFAGLLGRPAGLLEVLIATSDPQARLAKEMLRYGILRHVGSCIAVMGGVDAVVFATPHPNACLGFIVEICRALACAGVRLRNDPIELEAGGELTEAASVVKALCLTYDKWQGLAEHVSTFLTAQGNQQ